MTTTVLILASIWQVLNWSSDYVPADALGQGTDIATLQFPTNIGYTPFVAFLVTTNPVGSLVGKKLTFTFAIETQDDPTFVFGGHDNWNWGPRPPGCTFIISSQTGYGKAQYDACPACFWFYDAVWCSIGEGEFSVTLSMNGNFWSNAGTSDGGESITQSNTFRQVIENPAQVGIAFGGGDFFDVGVALMNIGGSATFHLTSFEVVTPLRINDDE